MNKTEREDLLDIENLDYAINRIRYHGETPSETALIAFLSEIEDYIEGRVAEATENTVSEANYDDLDRENDRLRDELSKTRIALEEAEDRVRELSKQLAKALPPQVATLYEMFKP